jgi:hypothetical protein
VFSIVPVTLGLFTLRYVIRIIRALRDEDIDTVHGIAPEAQVEPAP